MFFKKFEEVKEIIRLNKPHTGSKNAIFNNSNNVIEIRDVKKMFVNGELITNVLKGVDLDIEYGEFVVILGPSGSGKTTLMNIISGLDRASEGVVNVINTNLINLTNDELTVFRRKNIAYIFQQYGLLPNLKVKENIEIGAFLNKNNIKDIKKQNLRFMKKSENIIFHLVHVSNIDFNFYSYSNIINTSDIYLVVQYFMLTNKFLAISFKNDNESISVDEAMEIFGISHIKDKFPSQLSGGQQQRVSIARAICKNAKILFADEPTGAVDEEMSDIILDAFKMINKRFKTTIIIVTHNPQIATLATKVVYFNNGKIQKIVNQSPTWKTNN